jgi:thiosulfate/3-mercaptopyruvate sulfurtransferase
MEDEPHFGSRKFLRCVLSLLASMPLLTGCGGGGGGANISQFPLQFIVEAQQLPSVLARPDVVLLAAASTEEKKPLGFVNNAVLVDEDAWANFSFTADDLVDYPAWSAMIGQLGIDGSSRVLVYDDGELKFASRIRFLLAHFGVADANLVNGGFAAMQPLIASGALHEQSNPSIPVARTYVAHELQEPIEMVFRDDVAAEALSDPPTAKLVDVRTPDEFDGKDVVPPDTRGGHIPGAQNLPIEEFFLPGQPNELMSPMELAGFFASAGLFADQHIIVYCQDGAKSSLAALAMLNARFQNFQLYYLSYRNWQEDPDLPVVK